MFISLFEKISAVNCSGKCSFGLRWAPGHRRVYLRRLRHTERLSVDCHRINTALHIRSPPALVCTTYTHVAITPRLRAEQVAERREISFVDGRYITRQLRTYSWHVYCTAVFRDLQHSPTQLQVLQFHGYKSARCNNNCSLTTFLNHTAHFLFV